MLQKNMLLFARVPKYKFIISPLDLRVLGLCRTASSSLPFQTSKIYLSNYINTSYITFFKEIIFKKINKTSKY